MALQCLAFLFLIVDAPRFRRSQTCTIRAIRGRPPAMSMHLANQLRLVTQAWCDLKRLGTKWRVVTAGLHYGRPLLLNVVMKRPLGIAVGATIPAMRLAGFRTPSVRLIVSRGLSRAGVSLFDAGQPSSESSSRVMNAFCGPRTTGGSLSTLSRTAAGHDCGWSESGKASAPPRCLRAC